MTRRLIAVAFLTLSIAALAAFAQQPQKKSPADNPKSQSTANASTEQAASNAKTAPAADAKAASSGCPHMSASGCPHSKSGDCPKHATSATTEGNDKSATDCPMMHGQSMGHGQGMHGQGMHGQGMHGQGMKQGAGMQMRGGQSGDHQAIHSLMADHKSIKRSVTDIPNGVRTDTTSSDPRVTDLIRVHVRQMDRRIENGQPIRMFDPLFREIFANSDKIKLEFEDIEGGIRATETSADPNVTLLIRRHARAVDSFVAEGMARMHEPTPLPEGYKPSTK